MTSQSSKSVIGMLSGIIEVGSKRIDRKRGVKEGFSKEESFDMGIDIIGEDIPSELIK